MTRTMKHTVNFVVIFFIGFAVGLSSYRQIFDGPFAGRFRRDGNGPLEFFSRKLSLNDDQREKVKSIFNAHRPEIEASHEAAFKEFETIRNRIHQEILKVLTPEQQVKFEELQRKMEERRKERKGFGPPWGPPPQ